MEQTKKIRRFKAADESIMSYLEARCAFRGFGKHPLESKSPNIVEKSELI